MAQSWLQIRSESKCRLRQHRYRERRCFQGCVLKMRQMPDVCCSGYTSMLWLLKFGSGKQRQPPGVSPVFLRFTALFWAGLGLCSAFHPPVSRRLIPDHHTICVFLH